MKTLQEFFSSEYKDNHEFSTALKSLLASYEEELLAEHRKSSLGRSVTVKYTSFIDSILTGLLNNLLSKTPVPEPFAMIALGGYGRGELNLRSDIDLMFLYQGVSVSKELEELTKTMLYVLWDAGLDVAFGIRSLPECVELAAADSKTKTSFIDMRFLAADKALFHTFEKQAAECLFSGVPGASFIKDKIEERNTRHAKYGGSVFILEPNVKEGEGGLRDIHSAFWIARAKVGLSADLRFAGILSEDESRKIDEAFDFLLWVRNELHFKAGKKNDQLNFTSQERIAGILGHADSLDTLGVEAFMQRYYKCAQTIARVTSSVIKRVQNMRHGKSSAKKKIIDKNFFSKGGRLYLSDERLFSDSPEAMMSAIDIAVRHGLELDQSISDAMDKNLHLIGPGFRSSPEVARVFLGMLNGPSPYVSLSLMHRTGLLDAYIPEFARINCRAQHDMYHVYTVDAHSLFAVREAERLAYADNKSQFTLLSELYRGIKDKAPLLLGILFHDIGKAEGKGHAEKGARMVLPICKRLGLSQNDISLVEFLVGQHLIVADTAQYRDIHDEKLIVDFVKKVGDTERLKQLYILTFADVRAVGPEVWSQWKGALFQELYIRALTVMERGTFEPEDVNARISAVLAKTKESAPKGIAPEDIDNYSKLLPPRYFLGNAPKTILSHMKLIKELRKKPLAMSVRQVRERDYTEIVVATDDIHGLFSMVTGAMLANSVNILGAQINTLRNGIALDVFHVNNVLGELLTDKKKHRKLESDLVDIVTGKIKVDKLAGKVKPSILDAKVTPKVRASVVVDNEVSDAFTVVDIHAQDKLGLLYRISSTLTRMGVFIHIAKITTKGEAATDILYIRDIFGQKILDEKKANEIKTELLKAIS